MTARSLSNNPQENPRNSRRSISLRVPLDENSQDTSGHFSSKKQFISLLSLLPEDRNVCHHDHSITPRKVDNNASTSTHETETNRDHLSESTFLDKRLKERLETLLMSNHNRSSAWLTSSNSSNNQYLQHRFEREAAHGEHSNKNKLSAIMPWQNSVLQLIDDTFLDGLNVYHKSLPLRLTPEFKNMIYQQIENTIFDPTENEILRVEMESLFARPVATAFKEVIPPSSSSSEWAMEAKIYNAVTLALEHIQLLRLTSIVVFIDSSDKLYLNQANLFIDLAMAKYSRMLQIYEYTDLSWQTYNILNNLQGQQKQEFCFVVFSNEWSKILKAASRYAYWVQGGSSIAQDYYWILMLDSAENFAYTRDEVALVVFDNVVAFLQTSSSLSCYCTHQAGESYICRSNPDPTAPCPQRNRNVAFATGERVVLYTLMWRERRRREFQILQCSFSNLPCDIFPNTRYGFNEKNLLILTKAWFHYVKVDDVTMGNSTAKGKLEKLGRLMPDMEAMTSFVLKLERFDVACSRDVFFSCEQNDCSHLTRQIIHNLFLRPPGRYAVFTGLLLDVLESLASRLNFTYTLVGYSDHTGCTFKDISEMLVLRLVDLSLCLHEAALELRADVTFPVERTVFELITISNHDGVSANWLSQAYFVQPFTAQTYLLIGLCFVIGHAFMLLLTHIEQNMGTKNKDQGWTDVLFGTLGSLFNQGTLRRPRTFDGRLFAWSWSIMLVMTYAIYTGSLTATTAVVKVHASDLNSLLSQKGLRWGARGDLSAALYINKTKYNDATSMKLYDLLTLSQLSEPNTLSSNTSYHIERLLAGGYVYMTMAPDVTNLILKYCHLGVTPISGWTFTLYSGLALPLYSTLTSHIDRELRFMFDSGLLSIWEAKWKPRRPQKCLNTILDEQYAETAEPQRQTKYVKRELDGSLDVADVSSVFFLAFCGLLVSGAVLLMERVLEPLSKILATVKRKHRPTVQ